VDGSLMWFIATITLRRFVVGSGRRPPHQQRALATSLDRLIGAGVFAA
jgi:hypothetical protein